MFHGNQITDIVFHNTSLMASCEIDYCVRSMEYPVVQGDYLMLDTGMVNTTCFPFASGPEGWCKVSTKTILSTLV